MRQAVAHHTAHPFANSGHRALPAGAALRRDPADCLCCGRRYKRANQSSRRLIVGMGAPRPGTRDWESMWAGGLQPGQAFDCSRVSPVTVSKLRNGELNVKGKICLVPGCGRGYDVVEFVKHGAAAAVGLEIAPTAVIRAREYRDSCNLDVDSADRASFEQADFFEYSPPTGGIDVGYDYTFLCAMPPELRQKWAATWSKLIKPGGELVTLIFPVDPGREGGPPFSVSPELYTDLLTPVGGCCSIGAFLLLPHDHGYVATGFQNQQLEAVPQELSHEERAGREYFARWRRNAA